MNISKRRPRVSRACENCRKRKRKCSGKSVCSECVKFGEVCIIRSNNPQNNSTPRTELIENDEKLEIPDYLLISGKNDAPEYFGPASNYSFINQLNHFLRQSENLRGEDNKNTERFGLKQSVYENSLTEDFNLDDINVVTMNKLLIAFLETWSVTCPIFEARQLFDFAAATWKNEAASLNDKALLYLILGLGASTSYFDIGESNADVFPLAKTFFNLAHHTVPNITLQVSFEAVKVIFFMAVCACALGDTSLSYIYSGIAVRISLAIGLHKNNSAPRSPASKDRQKVWVSIWQFEHYWSFCVGRPSGLSESLIEPEVRDEDFTYEGYGEMNSFVASSDHMRLRVKFATSLSKIHTELYNSKNDLLTILSKVEFFSAEIDNAYFASKDQQIVQSQVGNEVKYVKIERLREWFWIRIYYLYIKLIIFRPFLIFSVYLKNTNTNVPDSIRDKILGGSNTCVSVAVDLSNFIIDLNAKVRMAQPVLFISSYLETTSSVLLLYVVSCLEIIPDASARKIWDVLQVIRNFLNGSDGTYVGTTKKLAKDGLESLQDILKQKENDELRYENTYLGKIMKAVTVPSPDVEETQEEDMALEAFWLQTLDWISYSYDKNWDK